MGWFSSDTEKSVLATHPVNLDVTKQYGSGAEQDRLGQHMSGVGSKVGEKIKDGLHDIATAKGSGAEQVNGNLNWGYTEVLNIIQDRYGAHFGLGEPEQVRAAARSGYEKTKETATSAYEKTKNAAYSEYDHLKGTAKREYDQAKDATERGYDHAKNAAERGYERAKDAVDRALRAKGNGAEQDRLGSHFDYTSLDVKPVTRAALSIISKGGNLQAASGHGLGYDGWERAKYLAVYKGHGAEQVCHVSRLFAPLD